MRTLEWNVTTQTSKTKIVKWSVPCHWDRASVPLSGLLWHMTQIRVAEIRVGSMCIFTKAHTVTRMEKYMVYGFLVFWLRSSVVSVLTCLTSDVSSIKDNVLSGFLEQGVGIGACSVLSMCWPSIAVPPAIVQKRKTERKAHGVRGLRAVSSPWKSWLDVEQSCVRQAFGCAMQL